MTNNYRPISNLTLFIIKSQVQDHLKNNNLFEPFQSGFRHSTEHSTQTALVKIINDLQAADSVLLSILILLSAAFHTISHQLLMDRLTSIGVCGTVYQWFAHYLADRTQFVQI